MTILMPNADNYPQTRAPSGSDWRNATTEVQGLQDLTDKVDWLRKRTFGLNAWRCFQIPLSAAMPSTDASPSPWELISPFRLTDAALYVPYWRTTGTAASTLAHALTWHLNPFLPPGGKVTQITCDVKGVGHLGLPEHPPTMQLWSRLYDAPYTTAPVGYLDAVGTAAIDNFPLDHTDYDTLHTFMGLGLVSGGGFTPMDLTAAVDYFLVLTSEWGPTYASDLTQFSNLRVQVSP